MSARRLGPLIGVQHGSAIDLLAYFVSRSFGLVHYGAIYGAIAMAGALATAFALVLFGEVHDRTGSYDAARGRCGVRCDPACALKSRRLEFRLADALKVGMKFAPPLDARDAD